MFKDLKILKFSLILLFAIIIVYKQFDRYKSTDFIFNLFSYSDNQKLEFSAISNTDETNFQFQVKNFIKDEIIIDTVISLTKTYDYFDSTSFLTKGYPKSEIIINNIVLSTGIYLTNQENSFVVSDYSQSDITIVYPALNNLCYTSQRGKRIFETDTTFISTDLPSKIDEWTLGMCSFFSKLENEYKVNYITDLDIENEFFLTNTRLLVLYGRLTFWTPKMIENIEKYINNGGKLLIASSEVFYAKCCVDMELSRIELAKCIGINPSDQSNSIRSWNQISSDEANLFAMRYAFHSNYGGKNINQNGMSIEVSKHPVFKSIDLEALGRDLDMGTSYIGTLNLTPENKHYKNLNLNRVSLLAKTFCKNGNKNDNTGGVIEFKANEGGGKAIIIGSSDFCLKENQQKETISKLFLNSLAYLLENVCL